MTRYVSTRGPSNAQDFNGALLTGLAPDGGLYVPEEWPAQINPDIAQSFRGQSYGDLAETILCSFIGDAMPRAVVRALIDEAYASFRHHAVAPLRQLDAGLWLMELFHGPTLAFKDVALELLGRLFDHALGQTGGRLTIIGATSGDTGSAAMAAMAGLVNVEVFMLYPKGRVSEVQRRQMTTLQADNVRAIAIDGHFDDCQTLVKACFTDGRARSRFSLSAVNSINWARILAQSVYYAWGAVQLSSVARFVVPSGNFGNIYAGYVARRLGWHQGTLIAATNENDVLARAFNEGVYAKGAVRPTISPSMDIQLASNFERLLFEVNGRDGARTAAQMRELDAAGRLNFDPEQLSMKGAFAAARADAAQAMAAMRWAYDRAGLVIDPHTATGLACAQQMQLTQSGLPVILLGTAHPAKFPDAVERAIGVRPALPPAFADLYDRPERLHHCPNDLGALINFMERETRF